MPNMFFVRLYSFGELLTTVHLLCVYVNTMNKDCLTWISKTRVLIDIGLGII